MVKAATQSLPLKGQRSLTAAAWAFGGCSVQDQLGVIDPQEEWSLNEESSAPFSCKQCTPLKAHLPCFNIFCTWVFVFFAEKQLPGMHQEFPSVLQIVMELLTVCIYL